MYIHQSRRRGNSVFAFLLFSVLCGSAMSPNEAIAAGALAVGLPEDVVKGGFTYGYTTGKSDTSEAREAALKACRTTKDATKNAHLRSLCKVIQVYNNQCVAVAMDPAPGTPGVGWGVADDLRSAEKQALSGCEATAGRGRAAACIVDHSACDGTAK
jgi:hypothetical protein